MKNDKETVLKRYQQMSDEIFVTINPDELTDDGKAAYYEEKIRRKSFSGFMEKIKDENVEPEATSKTQAYLKAGRLFRLFGWITIGIIIIAIGLIAYDYNTAPSTAPTFAFSFKVLFAWTSLAILFFTVGTAIKQHKAWGRTVGIFLAIIQLFGFPIGTLIGVYILICLTKGWGEIIILDDQDKRLNILLKD